MRNKIVGIYKITSPDNKVYIGQSKDIKRRIWKHKIQFKTLNFKLYESCRRYGWEHHTVEILERFPLDVQRSVMDEREIYYMELYKKDHELLNMREGGISGKHSKETKRKQYIIHGTSSKKGVPVHTEQSRQKISEAMNGNKIWLGRHHSEETKKKISEARKNLSPEARLNLSNSMKGRKFSEETKFKMAQAKLQAQQNKQA